MNWKSRAEEAETLAIELKDAYDKSRESVDELAVLLSKCALKLHRDDALAEEAQVALRKAGY